MLEVGWHYFSIKGLCHHTRDEHEYSNIQIFVASNKYLYLNDYHFDIRIYSNIGLNIRIYLQIFFPVVLLYLSQKCNL